MCRFILDFDTYHVTPTSFFWSFQPYSTAFFSERNTPFTYNHLSSCD